MTASDVFISYRRDQRDRVSRIADALTSLGLTVWFDAKLETGAGFDAEINDQVKSTKCVLVCWTPQALDSIWVRAEAIKGLSRNILASVWLEPCELIVPFNAIHAVDLTNWSGDMGDPNWLQVLDKIGELCGKDGLREASVAIADERKWAERDARDSEQFLARLEQTKSAYKEIQTASKAKFEENLSYVQSKFSRWLKDRRTSQATTPPDISGLVPKNPFALQEEVELSRQEYIAAVDYAKKLRAELDAKDADYNNAKAQNDSMQETLERRTAEAQKREAENRELLQNKNKLLATAHQESDAIRRKIEQLNENEIALQKQNTVLQEQLKIISTKSKEEEEKNLRLQNELLKISSKNTSNEHFEDENFAQNEEKFDWRQRTFLTMVTIASSFALIVVSAKRLDGAIMYYDESQIRLYLTVIFGTMACIVNMIGLLTYDNRNLRIPYFVWILATSSLTFFLALIQFSWVSDTGYIVLGGIVSIDSVLTNLFIYLLIIAGFYFAVFGMLRKRLAVETAPQRNEDSRKDAGT
jgi:hypothetical protein